MIWQLASYYHTNALYKNLFNKVAQNGVEQIVISPRGFSSEDTDKVQFRRFGEKVWGLPERILFSRKIDRYYGLLSRLSLESEPPHLIHAHTLYSDGAAAFRLHSTGVPYIVTVRNTDIYVYAKYCPHLRPLARKILINASSVIFVNHKYQGKIEELLGINIYNEKVVVVPNAVDSFWLNGSTPSDVPQDDIVRILSVGKVDKNKNHRLLIKAIQLLNNTNNRMRFELTIIGDYKAPFGQQLKSQYACDSVNFVGKKNKEEIKLLMAKSDIFALVSFRETFGIVYAEALSQNLPIIYTKGQGFDGWTDNTEIAIGVDSQDIQELLTALQKFGKRSKSKQQGARLVNQVFNWDIVASKILSEYAKSSVNFSNTLPTNR